MTEGVKEALHEQGQAVLFPLLGMPFVCMRLHAQHADKDFPGS